MPEGDTVFRATRRLNDVLAGATITRFELRVPQAATVDLRGRIVREVIPYGKHIIHHIDEFTLHSHLKMEGNWQIYRAGDRWRKPAYSARAVIGATAPDGIEWETVGFDLADIAVLRTRDEHTLLGHLGPDPLASDWNALEASRRLSADTRPIHVALQDQRNVAGFGNEYVNEILFVRGIHPTTPATDTDTAATLDLGARMIRANRDRAGRTFTGDARAGHSTWVYRREGKPCRRCSTPIRRDTLGADPTKQRQVFWCPTCQPEHRVSTATR
ncbi:DNA-formamidopyrimidine glycosylase family protein (plasmid) [Coraliomargarita sp. W4R53]